MNMSTVAKNFRIDSELDSQVNKLLDAIEEAKRLEAADFIRRFRNKKRGCRLPVH